LTVARHSWRIRASTCSRPTRGLWPQRYRP